MPYKTLVTTKERLLNHTLKKMSFIHEMRNNNRNNEQVLRTQRNY